MASSPGTLMSLPGRKEPGGGEGRVQAERATRRSPQGQGNGPEGERSLDRCRSPDPGRRCPCGCPQHVDRLGRSTCQGSQPVAAGWLPTIMGPSIRTVHIVPPSSVCGDILRVGVHFLPAGDMSRVGGQDSGPRRRRTPPSGRTRTRPRGMPPAVTAYWRPRGTGRVPTTSVSTRATVSPRNPRVVESEKGCRRPLA